MNIRRFAARNKYPIFLFFIVLFFFWKFVANPGYIPYSPFSDLVAQDLLWKQLMHDTYQKFHELPLWNPYTFGGMPFLANHFSKMFYLPNMLFLFFEPKWLFGLLYIAHFFLAGFFIYLFAREIGIGDFGSFVSSLVYIFNVRTAMLAYAGLTNELPLIALFPAVLYFLERLIKEKQICHGLWIAVCIALMIFGVHTQYVIYCFAFFFFYAVFRIIVSYKSAKSEKIFIILCLFFSAMLGIMISSIQLFPSVEILKYDTRSTGIDFEYSSSPSLAPYHMITMLVPNFFGTIIRNNYWSLFPFWQLAIYIGILPLVLCMFSLRQKNHFVLFFIGVIAFSLVFAFGKYTPFYYFLYKTIPFLNKFRAPTRMLFFYTFSLSLIAGFGAKFLLKSKPKDLFTKKVAIFLVFMAAFCAIATFGSYVLKDNILNLGEGILNAKYSRSHDQLSLGDISNYEKKIEGSYNEIVHGLIFLMVALLAISLTFFLHAKKIINPRVFKFAILAIIITDLLFFSMPFIEAKSIGEIHAQKDIASFLAGTDKPNFRVLDLASALPQQISTVYNIEQVGGYEPMILGYYREYVSEMAAIPYTSSTAIPIREVRHKQMLNLLNVKYMVSDKKLSDPSYELLYNKTVYIYDASGKKIYSDDQTSQGNLDFQGLSVNYVYKNTDAMPRATFVFSSKTAKRDDMLELMKSRDFNPRKEILLESEKRHDANKYPSLFADNDSHKNSQAQISYYSPNRIIVEAKNQDDGFLLLSEVWYPGWRAFDNGKEIELFRADYLFRAVYLGKGSHKVEFVFDPPSYKIGKLMTMIGILIAMILFFINKRFKYIL